MTEAQAVWYDEPRGKTELQRPLANTTDAEPSTGCPEEATPPDAAKGGSLPLYGRRPPIIGCVTGTGLDIHQGGL